MRKKWNVVLSTILLVVVCFCMSACTSVTPADKPKDSANTEKEKQEDNTPVPSAGTVIEDDAQEWGDSMQEDEDAGNSELSESDEDTGVGADVTNDIEDTPIENDTE